ncbi:hypothetical protein MASR2M78_17000 [Treponema sp.]
MYLRDYENGQDSKSISHNSSIDEQYVTKDILEKMIASRQSRLKRVESLRRCSQLIQRKASEPELEAMYQIIEKDTGIKKDEFVEYVKRNISLLDGLREGTLELPFIDRLEVQTIELMPNKDMRAYCN